MTAASALAFEPADPDFARCTRESFARQGAMALLGASLGRVEPGRRTHCATGLQTVMRIVGRAGVRG